MHLVHRHMEDTRWPGVTFQVGCRIILDGEARSEAWEEIGPFETAAEACERACGIATDLFNGQIPGQGVLL